MPELIPTASEAEWLEARRKGVTASEIAVIMGLSPYSSPYALYHQKLGILPDGEDQAVFERGRVLEPYIAEKFAAAHPEFWVHGDGRELFAHSERPWMMATPDRLIASNRADMDCAALLECKTDAGSDEWGEEGTGEIPVHYRCQVLWQMDVMGVDVAHVACLRVHDWKIREYVIEHAAYCDILTGRPSPDECSACADQFMMRGEAQLFLDRIDRQDPPDVDWRPATAYALKQLHPSLTDETAEIGPQLADRWEAAVRNEKHWEQRRKLYEAQIREQAGSARRVVRMGPGQIPVARRDVYPVREHVRKASTTDKLVATPPKPKKES
jgi:putative phage-type endonuclease